MEIVVEPRPRLRLLREVAEIWRFRGLLGVLVRRDLTVRYKETVLGVAWAVLQPLALMLVLWLVLGRALNISTGSVPYPLFVLAGLLPWTFFATAVSASTQSLLGASHLIQKVYFPRLIIPLSTLGVALVDFAVGSALLVTVVAWHGMLNLAAVATIAPLLLLAIAAVATGTLCSALAAAYRDTRYVIPFLMQVWMFATPVIYPKSVVAPELRWVLDLNPMAPLVETFRGCILGLPVDWAACARSGLVFAVALWLAARFFMSIERRLADAL